MGINSQNKPAYCSVFTRSCVPRALPGTIAPRRCAEPLQGMLMLQIKA